MNNLSEKERELFHALDMENYLKLYDEGHWIEPTLYRQASLKCFTHNITGNAVDSLRRCYIALEKCNPYRLTPEWDNLIQL